MNPLDPEFQTLMNAAAEAFTQSLPDHFKKARCVIEECSLHAPGRLRYRISAEDHPEDDTEQPSEELHDAAYQLYQSWATKNQSFPGIELTVARQKAGDWKVNMRLLDLDAPLRGEEQIDELWQAANQARTNFYVEHFGPLPEDIQKLMNLFGIWPGGGLYLIDAAKLGGRGVCTTFGLSNVDMPPPVQLGAYERDEEQSGFTSSLERRVPRWSPPERAGYGYELLILTEQPDTWPLLTVSWFAQMEILKDLDLLGRVRKYEGMTVESIKMGDGGASGDFLIQPVLPVLPRLPPRAQLPNGTMELLVATWITRDEMNYSLEHGRVALQYKLVEAGVGQLSIPGRDSVLD